MNITDANNSLTQFGHESIKPAQQKELSRGENLNHQFMQLLVAQINNQSPLNPTDGTEFVNQMAQIAQLQSTESMASDMRNNSTLTSNMQILATGSLVGQKVMVESKTIEVDKQVHEARFTLENAESAVTVHLRDQFGISTPIPLGLKSAGRVDFTIDPEKLKLKPGKYSISVVAGTGSEGKTIPLELAGTVSNVRVPLDGRPIQLNIPGVGDVPYNKISQFGASVKTPVATDGSAAAA